MATAVAKTTKWYLAKDGDRLGPFSNTALRKLADDGQITSDMMVWTDTLDAWKPVSVIKGIMIVQIPPPAPTRPVTITQAQTDKPLRVNGHVTTEKTAKHLKAHQLIGLAMIVGGLVVSVAAADYQPLGGIGALAFLGGIGYRIVTSVRIWWNHG